MGQNWRLQEADLYAHQPVSLWFLRDKERLMIKVSCSKRWQLKMYFCPLQTKYYAVLVIRVTSKSGGGRKREGRSRRKGKVFPTLCIR